MQTKNNQIKIHQMEFPTDPFPYIGISVCNNFAILKTGLPTGGRILKKLARCAGNRPIILLEAGRLLAMIDFDINATVGDF